MAGPATLPSTDGTDARRQLAADPLALLVGTNLDQQVPMERVFLSPHLQQERLGKRPPGWKETAADRRSIADLGAFEQIHESREYRRAIDAPRRASS